MYVNHNICTGESISHESCMIPTIGEACLNASWRMNQALPVTTHAKIQNQSTGYSRCFLCISLHIGRYFKGFLIYIYRLITISYLQ